MKKKGSTLLESIIALFVISAVIVLLLQALAVGITGTLNVNRQSSALNIAKTQMDYIHAQSYNATIGDGTLSRVYSFVNTSNFSGMLNYTISGRVENVSGNGSLQKITTNVSYLPGKNVSLVTYKSSPVALNGTIATGMLVTDVIDEMPFEQPGGWGLLGIGTWTGYYHTFTTGAPGKISATWNFNWFRDYGLKAWGVPTIGIYAGIPAWATRDYLGNAYEDGVVFRPGVTLGGGCLPGCNCVRGSPEPTAIAQHPECGMDIISTDINNNYEGLLGFGYAGDTDQFEFTVTTSTVQPAGTYTVLFFNGEDRINFETNSASVIYIH